MRDIDVELECILIKYKVFQESGLEQAIEFIEQWNNELSGKEIIGLYGTGQATNNLLYFLFKYGTEIHIDFCFDKNIRTFNYKNRIKNNQVHLIEDVKIMNIDYMLIGSYQYREEMRKKLEELDYRGKIIDVFQLLEEYKKYHYVNYKQLFKMKQDYKIADINRRPILLQEIIKSYFIIRDFSNAFKYIDIYVAERYPEYLNYINLKREIQNFLNDIIQCTSNRSGDIIINWIDAVPYCERNIFPFLRRKAETGIDFKNAYTVISWTTDTMKTIMFGEYPIEGKLFLKNEINDESLFLSILKKFGYKFSYCGLGRFYKLFTDEVWMPINIFYDLYTSSIFLQWQAVKLLCQKEDPVCIMIHSLHETHEPFVSAEGNTCVNMGNQLADWNDENNNRQAECASRYLDSQLEFYEHLYGKHATKIYMSDHGRKGNSLMNDYKVHINLIINGENIVHQEIEEMFSLINFSKIVENVISKKRKWEEFTSESVLVQNFDAYDEIVIKKTLDGQLCLKDMLQCRGIITKNDKYFQAANGEEYYYTSCCEEVENEIENEMYKERILKLRKKCGIEYIDISKYEKFKYSHLLYEV